MSNSVTITVPQDYGYVIAVLVAIYLQQNVVFVIGVVQARMKTGIKAPSFYPRDDEIKKLKLSAAQVEDYMYAQRVHQNNMELMSFFLPVFLIAGLHNPANVANAGAVVVLFRFIYGLAPWKSTLRKVSGLFHVAEYYILFQAGSFAYHLLNGQAHLRKSHTSESSGMTRRNTGSWPNDLDERPLFTTLRHQKSQRTQNSSLNKTDYSQTHHVPPTIGHPGVHIPSLAYAPPGLSTEFMWECEYEKLPLSFLADHFPVKPAPLYPARRDTLLHPSSMRFSEYGGKQHFEEDVDHVTELLGGEGVASMSVGMNHGPEYYGAEVHTENEVNHELDRLKDMWKDVKKGSVTVDAMNAEMNRWRNGEDSVDSGTDVSERLHQEKVAKTGFGKVLKGQMHEPIRYLNQQHSNETDPGWKEHLHELRVADIGYGRVPRGVTPEYIEPLAFF
ncbi:hypothetical protein HDU99_000586 [Rhizoclosmatium hyalinum]|nr:hypothetical protein HDU99_000586 [Rhizoclosmatium hyalinum]